MFIISLTYQKPLNEVDYYLEEHVTFLKRHYTAGHFIASGRKVPRTGGVILAKAPSKAFLEEIMVEDPFIMHHIATYEITEVSVTLTAEEFNALQAL